jgi:hypothetical protein
MRRAYHACPLTCTHPFALSPPLSLLNPPPPPLPRRPQKFLHDSRHKHACRRKRGPGGRFLTKPELKKIAEDEAAALAAAGGAAGAAGAAGVVGVVGVVGVMGVVGASGGGEDITQLAAGLLGVAAAAADGAAEKGGAKAKGKA